MLIEFTVGNYRSFKDEATLSMVAAPIVAKDKCLDRNNVVTVDDKLGLLASAVIYGANASGKSNLLRAMRFMKEFVLNSSKDSQALEPIGVEPFRLDPESTGRPSKFEVVFIVDGRQYRYGFEATAERVVSEWLYHVPETRETRLFGRDLDTFNLSGQFREGRGLESKTRPNALFLSVVAQFNGTIPTAIVNWFREVATISGLTDQSVQLFTLNALQDPRYSDAIRRLVRDLDLGIEEIIANRVVPRPSMVPDGMTDDEKRRFLNPPGGAHFVIEVMRRGRPLADGGARMFNLFDLEQDESEGTKKLLYLAGPLVETLHLGRVLVVDELDARLHPLVSRGIITLFHSKSTNPRGAQLIFATHDTNLLSNKLFRRDQIWFTEKDQFGASHLASLAEYKVRNDASFEADYIRGKYGAIPYLGGLTGMLDDESGDEARPA